jgi:alpha/beta hydrolase fold
MKQLVSTSKTLQKYFGKPNNGKSLSRTKQDEPYNILSDHEIELEVKKMLLKINGIKVHEVKKNSLQVEEVRITLPSGGTLAAKWWGDKSIRPIVCIHGLQDNAGTFDRLIPLLPKKYSYLAIDLPGHGLSSWLPNGMAYHMQDFIPVLNHLFSEYNWDKISLLGHSMGSILCFLFASSRIFFLIINQHYLKKH